MDEPHLTPAEKDCLQIIEQILSKGAELSITRVAEKLGITKAGAQKHMNNLRDKGALHGPRVVGEWALTRFGADEAKKIKQGS